MKSALQLLRDPAQKISPDRARVMVETASTLINSLRADLARTTKE